MPDHATLLSPSHRLAPQLRRAITALPSYAPGRRPASSSDTSPASLDVVSLRSNESHYAPLPSVVRVVEESAKRVNRYPDIASTELRSAIAQHHGVDLDEVAVGPGSIGVLQQIIVALCEPGDEVIFAWRSFEAYPILVELAGAVPIAVPLRDEAHDLDAMAAAITERTRVVLVCSPNNPTGVAISAADLDRFLDDVPPDVLVVIDEAYIEYVTGADPIDAVSRFRSRPNIAVLRTFSKAHGLAGLRVGYAITPAFIADGLRRTGLPFAVTAIAQDAAIASLQAAGEMREHVAMVTDERRRVVDAVRAAGWRVPQSQANFFWLRCPEHQRLRLIDALAQAGILVRGYEGDGVRISLADPESNTRVIAAIRQFSAAQARR